VPVLLRRDWPIRLDDTRPPDQAPPCYGLPVEPGTIELRSTCSRRQPSVGCSANVFCARAGIVNVYIARVASKRARFLTIGASAHILHRYLVEKGYCCDLPLFLTLRLGIDTGEEPAENGRQVGGTTDLIRPG
jgi:hypothetical protein